MPVYERRSRKPGAKSLLYISYTITEEQRLRFGLKSRTVREPAGTGEKRIANAVLAQRRREIVADVWAPKGEKRAGYTVREYGERWSAGRIKKGMAAAMNERSRLRTHVFPRIGDMPLDLVQPSHIRKLFEEITAEPSKYTGKKLAPRMVILIYADVRRVFVMAHEIDQIIPSNPCGLKSSRGELPESRDKDPRWRRGAVYTREEVVLMIGDPAIMPSRQMTYALMFLGGMRVGEAVGRRWLDYDTTTEPLHCLHVATQYLDRETKKKKPREVPVHPTLAAMLARWKMEYWPQIYGRLPTRDDFIVPKQYSEPDGSFTHQSRPSVYIQMTEDFVRIGIRHRTIHNMRRTFTTIARKDGARPDLLRWVTHGPKNADIVDEYTSPDWETLCTQVSCIRISLRGDQDNVVTLATGRRIK